MASPSRTPQIRAAVATDIGSFLSWTTIAEMGSLYIRNRGANPVFIAFDALPAAASLGNGRIQIQPNEAINLDDISFSQIGMLCAAGLSTSVEGIGVIRPGNAGGGIA